MSMIQDQQYIHMVGSRLERFTKKNTNLYNFRCNICGDGDPRNGKKRGFFIPNKKHTGFNFCCHNCGGLNGHIISFSKWLEDFDHNLYQDYIFETFKDKPKKVDKTEDEEYTLLSQASSKPIFKGTTNEQTTNKQSVKSTTTNQTSGAPESTGSSITSGCQDNTSSLVTDLSDLETCESTDEESAMFETGSFAAMRSGSSGHETGPMDHAEISDLPDFGSDIKIIERPNMENLRKISDLPDEHGARKYLVNRGVPEEFFDKLYITWKFYKWCNSWKPNSFKEYMVQNFEEPRLIIPFYDESGELMMIQGRSFKKDAKIRYFSIKCDDDFPKIYGLERVDKSKIVQVWEGPIDSMFGDNAVAMAGADADPAFYFGSNYVRIYDNEPRNPDICKYIQRAIKNGEKVVIWPKRIPEKYDGNDMIIKLGLTTKQLNGIISEHTYEGIEAELMFNDWKRSKRRVQTRHKKDTDEFGDLGI